MIYCEHLNQKTANGPNKSFNPTALSLPFINIVWLGLLLQYVRRRVNSSVMPLPFMYGWRIIKYNPAFRDERGAYLKDEWTSVSDVGKSFDGEVLTFEEYYKIENAYVASDLPISYRSWTASAIACFSSSCFLQLECSSRAAAEA